LTLFIKVDTYYYEVTLSKNYVAIFVFNILYNNTFSRSKKWKGEKHKLKCAENFDIELHYTFITNI